MGFIVKLFKFYINSSIHVALAVFSLTWITLLELDLPYNEAVLYFVFYASITGYNFVKYFGIARFHHRQLAHWLKLIQVVSFICFLLMCYYALQLEFKTLVLIAVFGFLTVLYAIPFLFKKRMSLRHIAGLKVFLIALVWTGVTVFVPVINQDYYINDYVIILGLQRFIFILVLMLPFEIRDLKYDSLSLLTIPQGIGVKRTKILGIIFLISFVLLDFLKDDLTIVNTLVLFTITVVTGSFLLFSKIEQGKYYCSFWVEGLPIFWLTLVLFLN